MKFISEVWNKNVVKIVDLSGMLNLISTWQRYIEISYIKLKISSLHHPNIISNFTFTWFEMIKIQRNIRNRAIVWWNFSEPSSMTELPVEMPSHKKTKESKYCSTNPKRKTSKTQATVFFIIMFLLVVSEKLNVKNFFNQKEWTYENNYCRSTELLKTLVTLDLCKINFFLKQLYLGFFYIGQVKQFSSSFSQKCLLLLPFLPAKFTVSIIYQLALVNCQFLAYAVNFPVY